jgi:hypothetical protein
MVNGGLIGPDNTGGNYNGGKNGIWKLKDAFWGKQAGAWDSLYPFITFTFTNAGATGALGPSLTQLRNSYAPTWAQSTTNLDVTSTGIQLWTVPANGTYGIDAFGAGGGDALTATGGLGARQYGVFTLTKGSVIKILIGQKGPSVPHSQNSAQRLGAGGGGTFVTLNNNTILVIAGGGGGAVSDSWTGTVNGYNASVSTTGVSGQGGQVGGTSGGAGATSTHAGGAAGYSSDGGLGSGTSSPDYAYSFLNGGKGGRQALTWGDQGGWGGFGGGAGAGGLAAGGGGGYSGGGSGTWSNQEVGGGGGSINNGTSQASGVSNSGNGYVIITKLS